MHFKIIHIKLEKEKHFFSLSNVSTFTLIISQYLALDNKWICTMTIMPANSPSYHIFWPASSCTFYTWKKLLINKSKDNWFSSLKLLLLTLCLSWSLFKTRVSKQLGYCSHHTAQHSLKITGTLFLSAPLRVQLLSSCNTGISLLRTNTCTCCYAKRFDFVNSITSIDIRAL